MCHCAFAPALIVACASIGFGQTESWEAQRQRMVQIREDGHLREAFEAARKMLAAAERGDPAAPPLPLALHDYAMTGNDFMMYEEAEKALRRAIRLLEIAPPRDGLVIDVIRLRLAQVYLDAGRFKQGEDLLVELRRLWEQTQPESTQLATVLDQLAWLKVLRKDFAPAESLFQRSIHILETRTDVSKWRMADVLNDYAGLLISMKKYDESARCAERAQSLLLSPGVKASATLVNTWMLLGAANAWAGRVPEAKAYIAQSISAAQSIYGEDGGRVGTLMTIGAAAMHRCGDNAEAKALKKKADRILAKTGREVPGRFTIDISALR